VIDSDAATVAWERARRAPVWSGNPLWIHADRLRPNVLLDCGRLSAVIYFGSVGVGDPATDVIAARSVFGHSGRSVFRDALDVDDGTWDRARGIALLQAAVIIPYHLETNPGFVALAGCTVGEIVSGDRPSADRPSADRPSADRPSAAQRGPTQRVPNQRGPNPRGLTRPRLASTIGVLTRSVLAPIK